MGTLSSAQKIFWENRKFPECVFAFVDNTINCHLLPETNVLFISNANADSAQLFLLRSEVGDIEKGLNLSSLIQNLLQRLEKNNKRIFQSDWGTTRVHLKGGWF